VTAKRILLCSNTYSSHPCGGGGRRCFLSAETWDAHRKNVWGSSLSPAGGTRGERGERPRVGRLRRTKKKLPGPPPDGGGVDSSTVCKAVFSALPQRARDFPARVCVVRGGDGRRGVFARAHVPDKGFLLCGALIRDPDEFIRRLGRFAGGGRGLFATGTEFWRGRTIQADRQNLGGRLGVREKSAGGLGRRFFS